MTKHKEKEEDIIERKNSEKIKKAEMEPVEETEKKEEGIVDAKKKTDEYLSGWKRCQADFENYKKDQAKMLGEFRKFVSLDMILQILPVLDNFNVSLEHVPADQKDSAWVTGIIYIKKQLEDILKNNGVKEIEVKVGDRFDPTIHEAITDAKQQMESESANKIMKVVQKGYKIDGKVIRAVRVIVGNLIIKNSL